MSIRNSCWILYALELHRDQKFWSWQFSKFCWSDTERKPRRYDAEWKQVEVSEERDPGTDTATLPLPRRRRRFTFPPNIPDITKPVYYVIGSALVLTHQPRKDPSKSKTKIMQMISGISRDFPPCCSEEHNTGRVPKTRVFSQKGVKRGGGSAAKWHWYCKIVWVRGTVNM